MASAVTEDVEVFTDQHFSPNADDVNESLNIVVPVVLHLLSEVNRDLVAFDRY
jgi:hypothetical protein